MFFMNVVFKWHFVAVVSNCRFLIWIGTDLVCSKRNSKSLRDLSMPCEHDYSMIQCSIIKHLNKYPGYFEALVPRVLNEWTVAEVR